MTAEELKEAIIKKKTVKIKISTLDPIEYYVKSIVYTFNSKGNLKIFAELLDINENSIIRAPAEDIKE